ncbi:MAG: PepSY-associated TM helix domain-containing protein [Steroidobacteraceae bacterium]
MPLHRVHRYAGLAAGLLWCFQALLGVLLVFRWELDDAALRSPTVALDAAALATRIEAIERDQGRVDSVWTSGSRLGRFDIYYADAAGAGRTLRVDGAGHPLRDAADTSLVGNGGLYNTLSTLHQTLFAGAAGAWIIGLSGLLLVSNLAIGLRLAWPRARQWAMAMLARPTGAGYSRLAGWHRLLGLWLVVPAILIAGSGTLLAFKDTAERVLGAQRPEPDPALAGGNGRRGTGPAAVIDAALARYRGATLTALVMPGEGAPWYRVRLRTAQEEPRIWGTTTLYFSATDGRLLLAQPADTAKVGRRFIDALYPVHTGQIGGAALRAVAALTGAGLVAMFVLGFRAWRCRRASHAMPTRGR